jgi:hypothetical protein
MLSSALQESGHAIVVGDKTAGETLPAVTVELPTGARLLYPIANYKSSSGKLLEGNGVVPDRIVSLDRASLLNGRDVQMDAALRLIEEESKNAKLQTLASAPPDYRGPMSTGLGGAAPPPPPPRRKFTVAGDGRGITGSSATKTTELSPARDARAVKVIDEFLALATPKDSVSVLKTYEMSGKLELSMKGVKQLFDYKAFGDMPGNKYSEITSSAMTGEIRSINDGKLIHVQTDFGVDRKLPVLRETSSETEYFLPAIRVREVALFPKINYLGVFDRNGRKVHLIEARSANGASVALGFDVSTKMLASLASNYSTIGYDDFRKVGDFLMPFHVENGMVTKIDLTGVKINTTIDPAAFLPKERCFDKP